ncbi:MAG: TraB/GumN family protein [Clostridiales bacterium]|jgi:uncharacterized protein YbaP (TraB family)|nr:TraB/GumN family protein [Clostridiales bacterium]
MKRLIFLVLLVLILAACGREVYEPQAYEPTTPPQTEAAPATPEGIHGLLSYVEYGGNRAYIFGSMHLGRPYFFPLADVAEDALRRADVFAFEFDMNEMETLEGAILMLQHMFLPENQTLQTFLPAEVYQHFLEVLETFPLVNYEEITRMRPVAVSSMITALEIFPVLGIYTEYSVDSYVLDFARARGREIIGLNPLFHELSLLFNAPREVQIAAIATLTDRDSLLAEAYDLGLVQAYTNQDMETLYKLLRGPEPTDAYSAYLIDVILIQRSMEFAAEIDRLLRETEEATTFFVTIGIGHMLGDDFGNVLVALADLGHSVTNVVN